MDEWIYVKDGLPSKSDIYLVTWTGKYGGHNSRNFIELVEFTENGEWDLRVIEKKGFKECRVIAWMHAPDPCEEV